MLNVVLLTGCALAALCCVWCVWRATTIVRDAERTANALRASKGRLIALSSSVDALDKRLRKLSGRVYANEREEREEPEEPEEFAGPARATADPVGSCEQWLLAKQDGPLSPAARCECAYCTGMRAQRSRVRAQLVPPTAREQGELAKLNFGK